LEVANQRQTYLWWLPFVKTSNVYHGRCVLVWCLLRIEWSMVLCCFESRPHDMWLLGSSSVSWWTCGRQWGRRMDTMDRDERLKEVMSLCLVDWIPSDYLRFGCTTKVIQHVALHMLFKIKVGCGLARFV